ncbi:MAG: ribokinase [Lysobacteraceae bacterium]|nr:MAG: ribokinase [Xanthomonadaceae bacterium]
MRRRRAASPACDVVVVGSYNQDLIWHAERMPAAGETRPARFSSGPGGKGFNQAVAARRQGARTLLVAAVGRDAFGDRARELAEAEGIDARWQIVAGEATGNAAVWLDAAGGNRILVAPGANALLAPAHVTGQAEAMRAARVLLTQQEVHPVASHRAQQLAAELGLLRIHDPAPAQDGEDARRLCRGCDILTPNESEFLALLEARGLATPDGPLAGLADPALHRLCRLLEVPTVILTLGEAGVFVSHAEPSRHHDAEPYYRLPAEKVDAVDTTGAGDGFNGALAAAIAAEPERPLAGHVHHAIRCAALAVSGHGAAAAMPTREQVEQRFGAAGEP